jgi:hypothetical protein
MRILNSGSEDHGKIELRRRKNNLIENNFPRATS